MGEARISPLTVRAHEALAVGHALLTRGDRLLVRISTIRFESVTVLDSRLLSGRYEVAARRSSDGRLGRLAVRQLDAGGGQFEASLSAASANAPVVFELEADSVRISHYSLADFYGVTTGSALASFNGGQWGLEGAAEVANLDLEALQVTRRAADAGRSVAAFQGTANAALRLSGRGATLAAAVGATQLAGAFRGRWAALSRINLGAFAVKSLGMAGGTTRFSEFDGALRAVRYGLSLTGVGGRAGAMTARGDVGIGSDDSVRGLVRIELGGGGGSCVSHLACSRDGGGSAVRRMRICFT